MSTLRSSAIFHASDIGREANKTEQENSDIPPPPKTSLREAGVGGGGGGGWVEV